MKLCFLGDFYLKNEITLTNDLLNEIKESDRVFVNFEAPIKTYANESIDKVGATLFHETSVINKLKSFGVTDLCLANNHYYDLGELNAKKSTKLLEEHGFYVHGIDSNNSNSHTVNFNNIAIINVCESEFGVSDLGSDNGLMSVSDPNLYVNILRLKSKYKHIIVVVHAGKENILTPLPQWKVIYRSLIDMGVSAVIAHHPHVPQYIEHYNSGLIFYSLGNFIMDYVSNHRLSSIGLLVKLDMSSTEIHFSYKYMFHDKSKNTLSLCNHSKSKLFDFILKQHFNKNLNLDISLYDSIYFRRHILNSIPNFFYGFNFLKSKKNRVHDFLIHNVRFESHRFTQELYVNKKKKK